MAGIVRKHASKKRRFKKMLYKDKIKMQKVFERYRKTMIN